jgi:Spy/CpxP family protein refolding chaperone
MFRRSLVALSLVALLGGAGVALAQDQGQPPAQGQQPNQTPGAHGMMRMQQRLGLTDDQMTAIKAAYAKHRDEQRQTWQQLRAAQGALRQAALDGADATTIQTKTADVQRLMTQSLDLRVKVLQEIGPVLTPEQRAKFAQVSMHGGPRHFHKRQPATQS